MPSPVFQIDHCTNVITCWVGFHEMPLNSVYKLMPKISAHFQTSWDLPLWIPMKWAVTSIRASSRKTRVHFPVRSAVGYLH